MKNVCAIFGYTRQGYYKHIKANQVHKERDSKVIQMVQQIRIRQASVGGKKLHKMISPTIKIGRDYLFKLLAYNNLLQKAKRRFVRTSISGQKKTNYPNLIKHVKIEKPNQVWVVDITYLTTCNGFVYLFLVSDLFSRKILGYYVSSDLTSDSACCALNKTLATYKDAEGTIHHSDHGIQYLSKKYIEILKNNGMIVSLTGPDHCYDNAVAERINGILKQEFGLSHTLASKKVANELVRESVTIYNNERLHISLGYETPSSVYDKHSQAPTTREGQSIYVGDGVAIEKSNELISQLSKKQNTTLEATKNEQIF